MMKDVSSMGMGQEASITSNKQEGYGLGMIDYFHVECLDADGNFKWKETIKNLVTNEGLSFVIQACFTGEDAKPTNWFVGLKDTGAPAAADAANLLPNVSPLAWSEYTEYSQSVRQTLTLNNEASQATDNVGNVAAFTIQSPAPDVYGVFVVDDNTKNSASGATVLYGVGDFGAAKVVDDGDTLNVTVTLSAASA
jgi:hypothetical protein